MKNSQNSVKKTEHNPIRTGAKDKQTFHRSDYMVTDKHTITGPSKFKTQRSKFH